MKGAKLLDPAKLRTAMGRLDDFTTVEKHALKPSWKKLDMAQVTQISVGAAGFGGDCSRYEMLVSTEYYYIAPRNLTASVSNIPTTPSHSWWRKFSCVFPTKLFCEYRVFLSLLYKSIMFCG